MPYVLKNKNTGEIFSCRLINNYDIPYHGAKAWEDPRDAEEQHEPFLREHDLSPEHWELFEIEEHQLKMCNVKLNNNPNRRLFRENDGRLVAKNRDH